MPNNFLIKINNGIDAIVEMFSPRAAFMRRYARHSSQTMFSGYSGASKNRFMSSWLPGGGSADADLLADLPLLRERSRDLIRNDGFAAGIIKTFATNIIASGIKPQSRLKYNRLGITKESAVQYQDLFEEMFDMWTPYADATKKNDFYELQDLIVKQIAINGDVIVLPIRTKDGIVLQIIESDRLCNPNFMPDSATLRDGIEIDEFGKPVAYWIKSTHPGDNVFSGARFDDFIKYPAFDKFGNKNIFHLYTQDRPGQSRGIPLLAPVINLFKHLNSTIEASVLKERIGACFALFIKKPDALSGAIGRGTMQANGQRYESIEPGQIMHGNPGESMEVATPSNPGGTFDPLVVLLLRNIAAAINIPYEVLSKDFSRTNYSSARAAILDAVKMFKAMQNKIVKNFCQPVYNLVIEDAYLRYNIEMKNFYENKSEWLRVKWQTPGWAWIDPLKEVQAAEIAINNQILSMADICANIGNDWEETFEQIAVEKEKRAELGIELPIMNQAGNPIAEIKTGSNDNE